MVVSARGEKERVDVVRTKVDEVDRRSITVKLRRQLLWDWREKGGV